MHRGPRWQNDNQHASLAIRRGHAVRFVEGRRLDLVRANIAHELGQYVYCAGVSSCGFRSSDTPSTSRPPPALAKAASSSAMSSGFGASRRPPLKRTSFSSSWLSSPRRTAFQSACSSIPSNDVKHPRSVAESAGEAF